MSKVGDWEKLWQEAYSNGLVDDPIDVSGDLVDFGTYDYLSPKIEATSKDKPNQRWCNHEWYAIDLGFGPYVYNCKHCDMKKEDYEKEQKRKKDEYGYFD